MRSIAVSKQALVLWRVLAVTHRAVSVLYFDGEIPRLRSSHFPTANAQHHRLPEASPYASHIPALDGIRGVAVLAVMGSHLFPGNATNALMRSVRVVLQYGATGVDLFFVLSGFLITGILYDSLRDEHFFRKFYARRLLRIFPLYYGVLALYAFGALFLGMHFDHELWSLALYLQNTSLLARPIYAYTGPSMLPLEHFWTLAIEEQFYLVWPVIVFFLRDRRKLLGVCLLFLLVCPVLRAGLWIHGLSYQPVHTNTVARADSLLSGAALALLLRSRAHERVLRFGPWLVVAGLLFAGCFIFSATLEGPLQNLLAAVSLSLRYSTFNLLYTGLIVLALRPGIWTDVCRLSPLRSLGKYSYGLYVLHLPLFAYLHKPLRTFIENHVTANKAAGVLLTGLLAALLSVVAAYISFHFYERFFLRLKRFFSYQRLPAQANQNQS